MKINGSLVFAALDPAGVIENLRVEKLGVTPGFDAADTGRIIFNTADNKLYLNNGTIWVSAATGGDASALQTEVDAIEVTLGAAVNANGTFNGAGFTAGAAVGAASFTAAINAVAAAADSANSLDEVFPAAAAGNVIYGTGAGPFTWAQGQPNALSGVQAWDNSLAALSLTTAAADQLPYFNGIATATTTLFTGYGRSLVGTADVTAAQALLELTPGINVQAFDAGLASFAGLTGAGFVTVDATGNIVSTRTIVAPADGFTIAPTDGSGNPTFALINDLAGLEAISGDGIAIRTATGSAWKTTLAVGGSTGTIVVGNGNGQAVGSITFDLPSIDPVGSAAGGIFRKFNVDTYGRVTAIAPVTDADITALVDNIYVNADGDAMTGNLVMSGTAKVVLNSLPTDPTHAASKGYVDSLAAGLSWKGPVVAATTATITLAGAQTIDGVATVAGDRVLVKNQTTTAENGIYTVVDPGAWTRTLDADTGPELTNATVFVSGGDTQADTGWTQTSTAASVGTDGIVWAQFTGAASFTPGTGLILDGNTVNVGGGAGIVAGADEISIDLRANSALILTVDGTTSASADPAAQLALLLETGGALVQTGTGLGVGSGQITETHIGNSALDPAGAITGGQGVGKLAVNVDDATIVINGANALEVGIIDVGVNIVDGAIPNAKLENSSIIFSDGVALNDFEVELGATATFAAGAGTGLAVAQAGGTITYSGVPATTAALGVASFNTSHFSVLAGAVSLAATLGDLTNAVGADSGDPDDLLTYDGANWAPVSRATVVGSVDLDDISDVVTTSPAAGQVLSYNGTNWVNKKIYHVETVAVAATSWPVLHALGTQYCNVTVVDAGDEVVIPQSIVFDDANNLTVTFNTPIAGTVVVMGIV